MTVPYTGNATATQSPSGPPNLQAYPIAAVPVDGDPNAAATFSQAIKMPTDWLAYFRDRILDLYFGTGIDGSVSYSTSTALGATAYYNNFSVTAGTLSTCGFPIIARGTVTLQNCTISGSGVAATGATTSGYGIAGVVGPHGWVGLNGSYESTQGLVPQTRIGLGASGPYYTVISPSNQHKTPPYRFASGYGLGMGEYLYNATSPVIVPPRSTTLEAICGGAAGIPGSGVTGSQGGAGGTGGALVVIMAPVINLTNVTFLSLGGQGGQGQGTSTSVGGGGGSGGAFLFIGQSVTVSGCTYTTNAGAGGPAGTGGTAGVAGNPGNNTPTIVIVP